MGALHAESSLQSNFWKKTSELPSPNLQPAGLKAISNVFAVKQAVKCLHWAESTFCFFFFPSIYAVSHILMSRLGLEQTHAAWSLLHGRFNFCHTVATETLLGSIPPRNPAQHSVFLVGWRLRCHLAGALGSSVLWYTLSHTHTHTPCIKYNHLRCDKLLDAMRACLASDSRERP